MNIVAATALGLVLAQAAPPTTQKPFEPKVGQAGKDVVWVPTSEVLLEKMLDMAKVTPDDFVMDLGSGDGRNIIAAAKRGARGLGVEFNPDMVELSRRKAREAGVADKAQFVQGDMYEADISKASVLALFLLPHNMEKLRDKFLALKPGSRIVSNTYQIPDWEHDESENVEGECQSWCTSLLYIVPAKVAGTWRIDGAQIAITQEFQMISGQGRDGSGGDLALKGKLRGEDVIFVMDGATFRGKVSGDRMEGTVTRNGRESAWSATRAR
jgi:SAM-dependent methyltransferase